MPNRNGAPYDYVPYMKRRHEIPCSLPRNGGQNAAPVSDDQPRNVERNAFNRNSTVERDSVEKPRNSYAADRKSAAGQLYGQETGNSRPLRSSIPTSEPQSRKSSVDQKLDAENCKRDSTGSHRHSTGSFRNSTEGNRNSTEGNRYSTGSNRNSTECNRNSTEGNRNSTEGNRYSTEGNRNSTECNRSSTGSNRVSTESNN